MKKQLFTLVLILSSVQTEAVTIFNKSRNPLSITHVSKRSHKPIGNKPIHHLNKGESIQFNEPNTLQLQLDGASDEALFFSPNAKNNVCEVRKYKGVPKVRCDQDAARNKKPRKASAKKASRSKKAPSKS